MTHLNNPLNVFVAWHPFFSEGLEYANAFFSYYHHNIHDPLSRGIGIPVYYRTGENPVDIDLSNAEYNAIILLIDDNMIISEQWINYVAKLIKKNDETAGKGIILPIAISSNAFKLPNGLPSKNFIRLFNVDANKVQFLISRTTHELCRLLYNIDSISHEASIDVQTSPPPLKLFISHAKEDGVDIAKRLSDYVQSQSPIKTFFDANDISIGYDFTQEIEDNIQNSVLLVIQSDQYSSREWCRREVLVAKENNRPIIIINLYEEGEDRSFPYMANVKTIRFNQSLEENEMFEKIILLTMKETLEFRYHQMFISHLTKRYGITQAEIFSRPPELLSLLNLIDKDKKLVVYPDPPLGKEELDLINKGAKNELQFITPTYIPLLRNGDDYGIHEIFLLDNLNIGISISESQDIRSYGFELTHLRDALVEFARYLLASGASLSYGGDVRYDPTFNFAKIIFDLARNYQKENSRPANKITNFVSYPLYTSISSKVKAELADIAKFIEVPPPDNLAGDNTKIMKAETAEDLYVWARSLTEMRESMNQQIHARIILGGKVIGYKGKIPGVVEEAYLAIKSEKPVYLIGSMGGAAKVIIDCLMGSKPEELTEEYQFKNAKYRELYTKYNELAEQKGIGLISYKYIVSFFNEKGIEGLHNGLTVEENMKLFFTANTMEMISLVLKGLMSIQQGKYAAEEFEKSTP